MQNRHDHVKSKRRRKRPPAQHKVSDLATAHFRLSVHDIYTCDIPIASGTRSARSSETAGYSPIPHALKHSMLPLKSSPFSSTCFKSRRGHPHDHSILEADKTTHFKAEPNPIISRLCIARMIYVSIRTCPYIHDHKYYSNLAIFPQTTQIHIACYPRRMHRCACTTWICVNAIHP